MSKVIVTSAYPELTGLVLDSAAKLKMKVIVVEAVLEEALEKVSHLNELYTVDAIISRGATAELLKQTFSLPVLSLAPSEADVLLALAAAKNYSPQIGYFSYPNLMDQEFLIKVRKILQIEIKHYSFRNIRELTAQMEQAHHDGCEVTVGGGQRGALLARAFGMESFLIFSSLSTIVSALEGAREIVSHRQKKRDEEERQQRYILEKGLVAHYTFNDLVGPTLQATITKAIQFSKSEGTVIIRGESGTGKELFAQSIHNESPRKNGPFVAVNCASLPDNLLESELFGYEEGAFTGAKKGGKVGLFALADGGTIFLDEIGKMSQDLQARLLRVIQTRELRKLGGEKNIPLNVRLIAASNEDLYAAVAEGTFRKDLYYRLNVLNLHLLPLRERKEDIMDLVDHYLTRYEHTHGSKPNLSPEFESALQNHDYPGNIRELENILERYLVLAGNNKPLSEGELFSFFPELCSEVSIKKDLGQSSLNKDNPVKPNEEFPLSVYPGTLEDMETQLIKALLLRYEGNKTQLAEKLNISRTTLWKKLNSNALLNKK
ncbi:sigma-54 interacting regulator [Desulfosporosinus acidiphilus SJ4]|uniref:Sigma-54 interacting regulator n=1 Tax=Desulfosporosinus acidiphilus (strain DSM 22704 / JCM 16185 / SJ4) TaxID=646529 RepID=I4D6B1_DESAJ|nr:sigma-54-dependent Fis family transcriptional regulator [Desulfosporosinus acidiphilus]AFM41335.1 sigma-54 interacting regulator [Desulfosporosinus acidiphilus SJ4]